MYNSSHKLIKYNYEAIIMNVINFRKTSRYVHKVVLSADRIWEMGMGTKKAMKMKRN